VAARAGSEATSAWNSDAIVSSWRLDLASRPGTRSGTRRGTKRTGPARVRLRSSAPGDLAGFELLAAALPWARGL